MNDMLVYVVNYVLAILLMASVAGSVLFLCVKLFDGMFCKGYEMKYYYYLMRAEVLFCVFPAFLLAAVSIGSKNYVELGILEPQDGVEVVSYVDYFGIMMIRNRKLNLVKICLFGIWLIGFIVTFILRLVKEKIFILKIRKSAAEWDEESVNRIRDRIMQETAMRRKIRIYQSSMITTPFSAGMIRPVIYFPKAELQAKDLYNILKHEYIHCKRKDLIYQLLMMFIRGMHWYNPIICFFEREFSHYGELSCDEEALRLADADERYAYAQLVLSMTESDQGNGRYGYQVGFVSRNEKEMKRRITHIMRKSKRIAKAVLLSGILFFVGVCPGAVYAASEGFSVVNGHISDMAESAVSTEVEMEEYTAHTERTELTEAQILELEEVPQLTAEGANIDVTIYGTESMNLRKASLKKGDIVRVSLCSDNVEDDYVIGFRDINGDTSYVNSKRGGVMYMFQADKTSNYIIFVKGKNNSNGNGIHIMGVIR